tara:strand:- start:54 stop:632 length:579 start_codon:yes stop_codon:yes gene_type:complete
MTTDEYRDPRTFLVGVPNGEHLTVDAVAVTYIDGGGVRFTTRDQTTGASIGIYFAPGCWTCIVDPTRLKSGEASALCRAAAGLPVEASSERLQPTDHPPRDVPQPDTPGEIHQRFSPPNAVHVFRVHAGPWTYNGVVGVDVVDGGLSVTEPGGEAHTYPQGNWIRAIWTDEHGAVHTVTPDGTHGIGDEVAP